MGDPGVPHVFSPLVGEMAGPRSAAAAQLLRRTGRPEGVPPHWALRTPPQKVHLPNVSSTRLAAETIASSEAATMLVLMPTPNSVPPGYSAST